LALVSENEQPHNVLSAFEGSAPGDAAVGSSAKQLKLDARLVDFFLISSRKTLMRAALQALPVHNASLAKCCHPQK
jgi:hypothetical protein